MKTKKVDAQDPSPDSLQREELSETVFAESLCHRCKGLKIVQTKRKSTFLMCTLQTQKYWPQPVLQCSSFLEKSVHDEDSAKESEGK